MVVFSNDLMSVFTSLNPEVGTQKDFFEGKNSFESCRLAYTDKSVLECSIFFF